MNQLNRKPPQLESCFYQGRVFHERLTPKHHAFEYDVCMIYINLSKLTKLFEQSPLWSTHPLALARYKRKDFYGDPQLPLDTAVKRFVESEMGFYPDGDICVLTNLRYFGYFMSPLTTYYCHNRLGELVSIVAEVTNTPWREKHAYVIPLKDNKQTNVEHDFNKAFTVSPFNPVDMQYHWQCSRPLDKLEIHIAAKKNGKPIVNASLQLKRYPITSRSLNGFIIRYPLHTLKVITAIYYEAAKLFLKGVPFLGKNFYSDKSNWSLKHEKH